MDRKEINIYFGASSLLTALGDKSATIDSMAKGVCGLKYDSRFGMVAGCIESAPQVDGLTRFESLVVGQLEAVLNTSGVRLSDADTQIVLSTTKGNIGLLGEFGWDPVPTSVSLHHSARQIAGYFRCANQPVVISNACISGVSAFIVARDMLRSGRGIRHLVVVGCDLLSEFITSGFAAFKSVSNSPCRPYDAGREGLTLGEACGAVLLTTDEQLAEKPLVSLSGGASTNDANHISGPSRTGDGLYYAIAGALKEAGIEPDRVGFVNAHGTATQYNDEMESKAMEWAGLAKRPLNGLKGYIGHTLGASGVVETIICVEELRNGRIFGTLGYREQGTSVPLSVSDEEQRIESTSCCVKTASGFGGCNAAIVLDAGGSKREKRQERQRERIVVRSRYALPQSVLPFGEWIRNEYKRLNGSNLKFYKMSDLCKAVYVAAENLLMGIDMSAYSPVRRAVVLSNSVSSLETDVEHQKIVDRRLPEGASPAVFVYTLPNVAVGEICIRHRFQGDNIFFVEEADSGLAEDYARRLLVDDKADVVLCGWCDKFDNTWNVNLKLLTI